MLESLRHFLSLIFDKTIGATAKVMSILTIFLVLLIVDDILNFSYSYRQKDRLNQVKILLEISKDTTLSKNQKEIIANSLNEAITYEPWCLRVRKNAVQELSNFIQITKGAFSKSKSNKIVSPKTQDPFLRFITSNILFLLLALLFPILLISESIKVFKGITTISKFLEIFVGSLLIIALLFGLMKLMNWITQLIPTFNIPFYNYILNVLANILVVSIFVVISKKTK
ncbi:MAG: hypothetical protein U0T73_09820 [Chitinophagales bacterium]